MFSCEFCKIFKNTFFHRTSVVAVEIGSLDILDDHLICKVMDIATGNWEAGGEINKRQIVNVAKGVVRENNHDIVIEFGGIVELTNKRVRGILTQLKWFKHMGITDKVEPSPQCLAKERFTFQRAVPTAISRRDIPDSLVLNIGKTPLSCVSPTLCKIP